MPRVSRFCCCFDLKMGVLTLGWLGLMGCVVSLFTEEIAEDKERILMDPEVNKMFPSMNKVLAYVEKYRIISGIIASPSMGVMIDAALVYGTNNKKHVFFIPWLISHGISIIVMGLIVLYGGVSFMIDSVPLGALMYAIGLPLIAVYSYIWICVHSLYIEFIEGHSARD